MIDKIEATRILVIPLKPRLGFIEVSHADITPEYPITWDWDPWAPIIVGVGKLRSINDFGAHIFIHHREDCITAL